MSNLPKEMECLLCSADPEVTGIFVPTKEFSRRLGAKAGKLRTVMYALCGACAARPNVRQEVEDKLLQDMQVQ